MNIKVSTDNNIVGGEKFSAYISGVITETFGRMRAQISHVGVHFTDQNSSKVGYNDKRCVVEFHLKGKSTTAVTCIANSIDEALIGALEKAIHSIEHKMGKLEHR